jgi:hypothetical protein
VCFSRGKKCLTCGVALLRKRPEAVRSFRAAGGAGGFGGSGNKGGLKGTAGGSYQQAW